MTLSPEKVAEAAAAALAPIVQRMRDENAALARRCADLENRLAEVERIREAPVARRERNLKLKDRT
jgi:BMFP domain-containing protein YqiC